MPTRDHGDHGLVSARHIGVNTISTESHEFELRVSHVSTCVLAPYRRPRRLLVSSFRNLRIHSSVRPEAIAESLRADLLEMDLNHLALNLSV